MKHSESQLQISCVLYFRYQFSNIARLLFSVPNGEKREKTLIHTKAGMKLIPLAGKRLKDEGQTAGVSDVILLMPSASGSHSALCIEFKSGTKAKQTEPQRSWQALAEAHGNKYVIVRSFDEFRSEIQNYLNQ